MAAKKKIKKQAAEMPGLMDQRTVETALYEPRWVADRASVPRLLHAIDTAQAGDTRELFALYRDFALADPHVQGEFFKRKLVILCDALSVAPVDAEDADDMAAAALISDFLPRRIPDWLRICGDIIDSTLWPVSVTEKIFGIQEGKFRVVKLVPVPHHLEEYSTGRLRIRRTDPAGMPLSEADDVDPNRYIVHRGHLLNTPDNFGGPMRSILFWTLFRSCGRDWWIRFLDRFGSPFIVGKYEAGDTKSKDLLQQAFSVATKLFGIAVSRDVQIELKEASTSSGGDAFKAFHLVANDEISRLIVGQTLSSTASPTGMNSGVAGLQSKVRDDIRKFDAVMLLGTLESQLVRQVLDINGMPGEVKLLWGSASKEELMSKIGMLGDLAKANLTLSDKSLAKLSSEVGYEIIRSATPAPASVIPMSAEDLFYHRRGRKVGA